MIHSLGLLVFACTAACAASPPEVGEQADAPCAPDNGAPLAGDNGNHDAGSERDAESSSSDAASPSAPPFDPTGKTWRICAVADARKGEIPPGGTVITLEHGTSEYGSAEMRSLEGWIDDPSFKGSYDGDTRTWLVAMYGLNPGPGSSGGGQYEYGASGKIVFAPNGQTFSGFLYLGFYDEFSVYGAIEDGAFRCDPQ